MGKTLPGSCPHPETGLHLSMCITKAACNLPELLPETGQSSTYGKSPVFLLMPENPNQQSKEARKIFRHSLQQHISKPSILIFRDPSNNVCNTWQHIEAARNTEGTKKIWRNYLV
jgi:hypothetical protein